MQITVLYKVEFHDDGSQLFDIIFCALLYIFPEHLEELRMLKVHHRLGRLLWQHELLHLHFFKVQTAVWRRLFVVVFNPGSEEFLGLSKVLGVVTNNFLIASASTTPTDETLVMHLFDRRHFTSCHRFRCQSKLDIVCFYKLIGLKAEACLIPHRSYLLLLNIDLGPHLLDLVT